MNEIFEIKRFLLENEEIDIESRKFFLAYILNKYRYKNVNQINDYEVDINSLINDLRVLNSFLMDSNDTSLTTCRINKELRLIERVLNNADSKELEDISFELDILYFESGLPIRNTDTVMKYIKNKNKENTRYNQYVK